MDHFNIRKAELKDANGLNECMDAAYSKYKDRVNIETLPPLQVDYKDEIANYPVWVIKHNHQVVAGLIMTFSENTATLSNIAIHPNFQNNGLGKKLLNFAEKEAANRGYEEMNLATHTLFRENVSFYQKQGWIQIDQNDTRIFMKKHI
ncbi:GNAT family N-acetyltransferase [Paraliobacillus salinarum]|uniref:GNAT family N-acetyltransferase n=1 Tax=Paraliobacillus salinarum TaxID=1158996 RepID=UPI0015F6D2A3|nr:GNAT family N-acetyltransferase [Paraliobacillus salinarum]